MSTFKNSTIAARLDTQVDNVVEEAEVVNFGVFEGIRGAVGIKFNIPSILPDPAPLNHLVTLDKSLG